MNLIAVQGNYLSVFKGRVAVELRGQQHSQFLECIAFVFYKVLFSIQMKICIVSRAVKD